MQQIIDALTSSLRTNQRFKKVAKRVLEELCAQVFLVLIGVREAYLVESIALELRDLQWVADTTRNTLCALPHIGATRTIEDVRIVAVCDTNFLLTEA